MTTNLYLIISILLIYFIVEMFPINKTKKNNVFLIISFFMLFIVLVIRKPISDMGNYFNYFDFLHKASFEEVLNFNLEFLYKILNVVIANILHDYTFFMIITEIIILLPVYFFIKRYSKNYLISILLFVTIGSYYMHFFILRQAIAIGILLLSVKYIENKNMWKFIIFVVIATLFHRSSLIFILAYFICNIKPTTFYYFIWIIIYGIAFIFKNYIIAFISSTTYGEYSNVIAGEGYGKLLLYFIIIIAIICIDNFKKDNKKSKKLLELRETNEPIPVFINLTLILVFFQILATGNSIVCRMGNDFLDGVIILVPNVISKLNKYNTKSIIYLMVFISIIIYSIMIPSIIGYEVMILE